MHCLLFVGPGDKDAQFDQEWHGHSCGLHLLLYSTLVLAAMVVVVVVLVVMVVMVARVI
jgi:hypothetical protein